VQQKLVAEAPGTTDPVGWPPAGVHVPGARKNVPLSSKPSFIVFWQSFGTLKVIGGVTMGNMHIESKRMFVRLASGLNAHEAPAGAPQVHIEHARVSAAWASAK
jgi:hypothetical protein